MATRAHVLGELRRELAAARDVHADAYAAQLEQRIAALSQGSAGNPAQEKTGVSGGQPVRPGRSRRAR